MIGIANVGTGQIMELLDVLHVLSRSGPGPGTGTGFFDCRSDDAFERGVGWVAVDIQDLLASGLQFGFFLAQPCQNVLAFQVALGFHRIPVQDLGDDFNRCRV